MTDSPYSGLFRLAQEHLESFRQELTGYGIEVALELELREGKGLLCYYDLTDGHIYLSLPDPTGPIGRFQAAVFRSLLGCSDDAELAELIRLLLPWLMSHELAHYLRHRYGRFGDDLWHEEQVANQLASAATYHRTSIKDRERLGVLLRRTLKGLAPKVGTTHMAVDTHHNPLQALGASGVLGPETMRSLELLEQLFEMSPEQVLRETGKVPHEVAERLEQRQYSIDDFNEDYTSSLARYVYFQFGWMLIDLESRERNYVDEFARLHLGHETALLDALGDTGEPTAEEIASYYLAHQELADRSPTASRYFFKRYRSLLLDKLEASLSREPNCRLQFDDSTRRRLECQDEEDHALLDFLALLAPPDLRHLFPGRIAESPARAPREIRFASQTDERLWRRLMHQSEDEAAAGTLARLGQLDSSDVYRTLPAEMLLELTRSLYRVRIAEGETVIWQGCTNEDVFILVAGELDVLVRRNGVERTVSTARPGEVLGEIAYFTGEPRTASVRARLPSECLVLRSSSLRQLSDENPAVLIRMARVLARRLSSQMRECRN